MVKKQKRVIQTACNVVNLRLTARELSDFEKLMDLKWSTASILAQRLFMNKFPEFVEKNQFGVYIPYTKFKEDSFVKTIQFRINDETAAQLEQIIIRTGLTKCAVARMMILPGIRAELTKCKTRR